MKFANSIMGLSVKSWREVINRRVLIIAAITIISAAPLAAEAGTVVVSNDEWELSNTGFSNASNTGQFVANLVSEFGPKIHAYSNNFGFTETSLATAMSTAGATYTTGTGISFNLPTLSSYDAIFLGGNYLTAAQITTLEQYVANGGNVYLAGGTGPGGAAAEAAAWNPFLTTLGLSFASTYNGIGGNIAVSGDPIFAGVSALYQNNGQTISGTGVVCCTAQNGLYAVVRTETPPTVPEPSTLLLFTSWLIGIAIISRFRFCLSGAKYNQVINY